MTSSEAMARMRFFPSGGIVAAWMLPPTRPLADGPQRSHGDALLSASPLRGASTDVARPAQTLYRKAFPQGVGPRA